MHRPLAAHTCPNRIFQTTTTRTLCRATAMRTVTALRVIWSWMTRLSLQATSQRLRLRGRGRSPSQQHTRPGRGRRRGTYHMHVPRHRKTTILLTLTRLLIHLQILAAPLCGARRQRRRRSERSRRGARLPSRLCGQHRLHPSRLCARQNRPLNRRRTRLYLLSSLLRVRRYRHPRARHAHRHPCAVLRCRLRLDELRMRRHLTRH